MSDEKLVKRRGWDTEGGRAVDGSIARKLASHVWLYVDSVSAPTAI